MFLAIPTFHIPKLLNGRRQDEVVEMAMGDAMMRFTMILSSLVAPICRQGTCLSTPFYSISFRKKMSAARGVTVAVPRFRSAVRKLAQHGAAALQPQLQVRGEAPEDRTWHPPAISGRISSVIRKQAVRDGTYGSFDKETGAGWDPVWDVELAKSRSAGSGRYRQGVHKHAGRVRSREKRAQKIEKNMEGMDQRMEDYLAAKAGRKPPNTFENMYKKLMLGKK
jgi:hypothetical protein